jgi:ElaB/YqjD/DUF883 family membrane-anchored ribosome-binding protein
MGDKGESWAQWAETAEKKMNELIAGANTTFADLMEASRKNFEAIQASTTEGKNSLVEKLKTTQAALNDKIKTTRDSTMKRLDDQYKAIQADSEVNKGKAEELRKNFNQALDDIGDKGSKQYNELKEKLKSYSGKTKEDFIKYFTDVTAKLNAAYDEAIKKVQASK